MREGQLHVVGKWFPLFSKFLGNHIEHVVKLMLGFFWRAPNRVTTFNRRNISDVTAVVIASANDLIIKQRLHGNKLTSANGEVKNVLFLVGLGCGIASTKSSFPIRNIKTVNWRMSFNLSDNPEKKKPLTQ